MAIVDYDDGSRIIDNVPVYYQGSTSTCAQACVTSVLQYWGFSVDYNTIIQETSNQTLSSGMAVEQMVWYFRRYGLQSRLSTGNKLSDIKTLINRGCPVVVAFDEGNIQHVIVVIGYNDEREVIFYNDSMDGETIEEPYSDFVRAWNRQRANSGGYFDSSVKNTMIIVQR